MLLDNGITADEIKLYGEEELVDDALEESPGDGEFTELENIISKVGQSTFNAPFLCNWIFLFNRLLISPNINEDF